MMYMEEQRPVVWYGAQAGGWREDDGEARVRMLGTEVLPVDEEGVLPRLDVAEDKDGELHLIKWYIREKKKLKEVDEKKWKQFVAKASKFFLKDDRLWKKQPEGWHQLAPDKERCYGLVKEAHNDLRHKGVFSVLARLRDRFWWPRMGEDVKWYVRTCHKCQVRQMKKVHIPPTVLAPGSLFWKIYIDVMHMLASKGFKYILHTRCSISRWPEYIVLKK